MNWNMFFNLIYVFTLVVVSYTDLRWKRIPNKVTYPAILFSLALALVNQRLLDALAGGTIASLILLIPVLIYGPRMAGIGDVKLALFIGTILGIPSTLYALWISCISAGVVALAGLIMRRMHRKTTFPFAPFLSFGAIILIIVTAFQV